LPWVKFINAFGQTETASTITSLGPEDHVIEGSEEEKEKKMKRLSSSIGKPLPDVEVKVVDEQGSLVSPGEVGESWRGVPDHDGVLRDEQKTSQVMTADGWLRTGDMGWKDEEGYIYLAGRGDDMIIRGGEKHLAGRGGKCASFSPQGGGSSGHWVSDPEWGQEPRAMVVLKKGEWPHPKTSWIFAVQSFPGLSVLGQ